MSSFHVEKFGLKFRFYLVETDSSCSVAYDIQLCYFFPKHEFGFKKIVFESFVKNVIYVTCCLYIMWYIIVVANCE